MGRFPNTESDVAVLADEMIAGLTAHADIYPAPPVTPAVMTQTKDSFVLAHNGMVDAQAAAERARAVKDLALDQLTDQMKKNIRYAENTVSGLDEYLKMIGWSGRKPPEPLQPPGQTQLLVVTRQEEGEVDLSWKAPENGGRPSAYRVLRRERPSGPWTDVATAVKTEALLTDQPRGKEFEFRIIAVNKSGEGEPSNTVVVVL